MTDVHRELPDQRLADRYRLIEPLGEGGMALVVKAWDETLDVPRAVKVLLPALAEKRSLRARFETEAKTMARLEHPAIVRVYDVGLHGKIPYIAMELLEGGSLEGWLEAHGPMPPRQAVQVMLDLCGGVAHAHAHGVIHRDIKPQNVLVAADGTVKLTDFGIARTDHGKTKTGAAMGTLGYVAPEQLANAKATTPAADVYSLAVTLWKLVTDGAPERLAYDLGHGAMQAVPGPLVPLLEAALTQRVEQRTQDVATFQAALRGALEQLPTGQQQALVHAPRASDAEAWESMHQTLHGLLDEDDQGPHSFPPRTPAADRTPVPSRPPEKRGPYVVRLTDEDVEATLQARNARRQRGKEPSEADERMADRIGAEPSLLDDEGWAARIVRSAGGAVRLTLIGMLLLAVPIGVVIGLRIVDRNLELETQREALAVSATTMVDQVLFEGPQAVKDREREEGKRQELIEHYLALEDARTKEEKQQAAVAFVEAVERDVASTLPEDPTEWTPKQRTEVDRLLRMRQTVDAFQEAQERVEELEGEPAPEDAAAPEGEEAAAPSAP